ncbi:CYFA0S06e02740g1_1 [Cyberlindnera fabianii]|uniref:CYFA0S06e02740g1_1 n=1 Tax=Cyberlindnera fabianii TaxID=36022 RepID=A0A061B2A9_CYBFA|nr:CYFA0S06e02740g1_1 [Cyberlindnera fabianii]
MSKTISDSDLISSLKKATSLDETAPKRKHVRACIVYTWDHKSSRQFFNQLKLLPVQGDEVQLFKTLITIHKVLQEGHGSALKEAMRNADWIEGLGRSVHGDGFKGYGRLIKEYVVYLLRKLNFHKNHRGFNGTFEYEEYVSLVTVQNPDEGYEAILDLMTLQDALDDLQRLIFASISHDRKSECKISALVPLVAESYGIYKFITSMLRAIHRSTGSDEALEPLRERYESQHARLYEFYADCSSIRYLTSLITIPRLPETAPNLISKDESDVESERPASRQTSVATPVPEPISEQPTMGNFQQPIASQPTGVDFWNTQQNVFEAEQQRLAREAQENMLQQQQQAEQQRIWFEQQQAAQAEQQRLAQEQLLRDQLQNQAEGRVAELERDLLAMRQQYENDQLLLQQYDQRVKTLEQEIATTTQTATQQLGSKDELLNSLQEQLTLWKNKYDSLAKLYSQLRQEHLNLLNKFKKLQQKAASAQEAIERREKLEKDLKSKNVELAGLIRERDRARLDLEKIKGGKDSEIDKLELQIRDLTLKLDDSERSQSSNLSSVFASHKREMEDLKAKLETQSRALNPDLEQKLKEKEEELEIVQQTMDDALQELARVQGENDEAINEQLDAVLIDHLTKLTSLVDAILASGIKRIQDSLYELDSPMQAGNQNSSPEYLLSIIEKAQSSATDFANSFNDFIADGPNGDHSEIIRSINEFTSSIADVLLNAKGIVRLVKTDSESNQLIAASRSTAQESEDFLMSLLSDILEGTEEEKTEVVISGNLNVQEKLQELIVIAENLAPRSVLKNINGDLGDAVDNELNSAASAITSAAAHLKDLLNSSFDSSIDGDINKAILSAAISVTNSIALLIQAAIETQNEIVTKNQGSGTRAQFYKKHNRWTEGLISAAKAVAASTKILIGTADGVLSSKNTHEELIVASNEVAASTAQLVAASRVKATFMSKTQDTLENASKTVTSACRSLVNQVQDILNQRTNGGDQDIDFSKLTNHENKTMEMEQQVEILKLENALASARKRLGEIRKYGYRDGDSDEE